MLHKQATIEKVQHTTFCFHFHLIDSLDVSGLHRDFSLVYAVCIQSQWVCVGECDEITDSVGQVTGGNAEYHALNASSTHCLKHAAHNCSVCEACGCSGQSSSMAPGC